MKHFLFLMTAFFLIGKNTAAQQLAIIPQPQQVQLNGGFYVASSNAQLQSANKKYQPLLSYANQQLHTSKAIGGKLKIDLQIVTGKFDGGYLLHITNNRISINAADHDGLFNGVTTLLQIWKSSPLVNQHKQLPCLTITDGPRYAWRGFMLDESRHFFGIKAVKELLDWMAFYKLNRFHWHLTDADGWRIAIKKYPLLTSVGGEGNHTSATAEARYYTQIQIKEIVNYATERHIMVIPEIDMPGHATAANKAYPSLSGGKAPGYPDFTFNPAAPETYTFITNVLAELKNLFPAQTVHIGGDEVALGIKAWDENASIQAFMKQHQFANTDDLTHYFMRRVADSAARLQLKTLVWDEAVAGNLPASQVSVTWWRHNKPEVLASALAKGYNVVLCPRLPFYFDFVQDSLHKSGRKWVKQYNSYLDVYHFPENQLTNDVISNPQIIGLQANLWTETVISTKRLEYLLFPRLAALSSVAWENSNKDQTSFNNSLKMHLGYYAKAGIYYYNPFKPAFHPEPVDRADNQQVKD